MIWNFTVPHSINISLLNVPTTSNIQVYFKVQGDDGLISREDSENFTSSSDQRSQYISKSLTLTDNDDFLHIYVDNTDKIHESNERNNYVLTPLFEKTLNVYFDINTSYPKVDNKIKEYLKLYVNEQPNQLLADVTFCIGRKCSQFASLNEYTLGSGFKTQKFGYKDNHVTFNNNVVGKSKPYNAVVGGFYNWNDNKKYILAYGNDIDGDIAAVKKLVSGRELFFSKAALAEEKTRVVDDLDLIGISVADLFRNPSNFPYYSDRNSDRLSQVIERILNNNNFEIAIRTVKTTNDNTTLRLKNVNSDLSDNFRESITNNSKPIVFSGGLWNNLNYWENSGTSLTDLVLGESSLVNNLLETGRDLWEIEITGGQEQDDKPSSPNYTYNDTRDYYWPALIAGVQNYSGQKSLQYVGHSNGCGVAIASLNSYQASGKQNAGYVFDSTTGSYLLSYLSANPIETFIGVGCPGALDGYSPFYEYFGMFGSQINEQLDEDHITAEEVSKELLALCKSSNILSENEKNYCILAASAVGVPGDDYKVSRNLLLDYLENLNDVTNYPQVNQSLSINKFKLYSNSDLTEDRRNFILNFLPGGFDLNNVEHDIVVSQLDSQKISDRVSSNNANRLLNLTDFNHGRVGFEEFVNDAEEFLR